MKRINKKELFSLVIVVLLSTVFTRLFIFDVFVVKGDSMAPTILSGDVVFINKLSYFFGHPKRGDIVVVTSRVMPEKLIKRIIGLPGERLEITDSRVVIKTDRTATGTPLVEDYLEFKDTPEVGRTIISLDPKEYFVMGDRRYVSIDSRELGPVDDWQIKGKVVLDLNLRNLIFKPFFK